MAETSDIPSETLREWARDDRVTLAIVFTDIVGATALGRALGDEQMNGVRRVHFGHSRALLAQHAGREIKTIGDSVMAVFRSIGAALDYAHALYLDPGHGTSVVGATSERSCSKASSDTAPLCRAFAGLTQRTGRQRAAAF